MIDPTIKDIILSRLRVAEQEHQVRILYACESGSRAWGFPSPDSDYDVRFIYAHPREWYLSYDLERHRDVIEYPIVDEIDCGGWDIRKALGLFAKSNGTLCEWIKSPVQYLVQGDFLKQVKEIEPQVVNLSTLYHRYLSMIATTLKRGLIDQERRNLKRYFYVLRPLLAIRYMESSKTAPPIEFQTLVTTSAPKALVPSLNTLVKLKAQSRESEHSDPIQETDSFIESELARHQDLKSQAPQSQILDPETMSKKLNEIFRSSLER